MKLSPASITTTLFSFLIFFWNPILVSAKASNNPAPYYTSDVAINCGYLGNSTAHDGRLWFGDTCSGSVIYMLQPRGQSSNSTADHKCLSADPIPYMTARVSTAEFYYTFKVDPGQKFIRLHFYPSSYRGFEKSQDFFTVEAGPFTLLRNFSPSLAADAIGVKYLVKEFCLNVQEDEYLNLTFSPSHCTKKRNLYAFVNGIEIISMPTGLYYTPEGDLGARVVGQNTRYFIDNSSALETVQRLNIGGNYISPAEDFGMFRRWTEDANYLLQSNLQPVNHFVDGIKYGNLPAFAVPLKIYFTSWKKGSKYGRADEMHNFTWKIPVDTGFGYLVRLHFCDFSIDVMESERQEFNVLVNNQIAETKANVKRLSGGTGVLMYRDYVVIVKGDKREGKFDFLITLQSMDELVVGLLYGLEIFKLSSLDNNLASPNPVPLALSQVSSSWNLKIQNLPLAFGNIKGFIRGMTVLIILLNIIIFKLRQIWEDTCHEEKDNISLSTEQSFHRFSFAEIKSATENFSDVLLVGRGGFGNVYKGFICGGSRIVAVKRLKSNSKQGAHEFWTEIETLSKIRHIHLVPLLGYCNEYGEMILVYEYISRGTLAESLYKAERNGMKSAPLTWEQRLRICIGTARALDYLHTGIVPGIIHRDVKDTNILLDENLVAKISDFGLSKLEKITESQYYISTKVKGTPGYLDPDYLITQKLTRKSDIYSFGVVLLVVLCGKPAVDRSVPGETQTLLSSYRECIEKGRIEDIIDPSLRGRISSESLSEFLTSVESCLHHQRKKRSTMAQVVARLECSLERQQIIPSSVPDEAIPVAQSSQLENVQPSQFDQDMVLPIQEESLTVISPMEEGNISIHTSEVKDREDFKSGEEVNTREVFKSGEKDHTSVKKPSRVRPWEALRSRGKTTKKDNLVSASIPQTHRTEGETLQFWHVKNVFSFAYIYIYTHIYERKLFTRQLRPGPSPSTQKTSQGWPWNRGKHTKKLNSVSEANTIDLSWNGTQTSNLSSTSTPQIPRSEGVILQFSNLKHFSITELRNATRNFRPDTILGKGGFGSVFKGWIDEQTLAPAEPGTGMMVAIKRLNQDGTQGHREWLAEVNYLGRLCHPNLVKLIGYCLKDKDRLLVYEFMSKCSMDLHLFRRGSYFQSLSANLRIKIVLGAARGLAFLHGTKIIYRDFKTSNILLDKNYNAKLSDFGLAKDGPTEDSTHVSTRVIGTYGYAAPEYIMTGHLTAKSDVYGFGVVLLEVLTGRRTMDRSRPTKEHNLVEWAKPYLTDKRRILQVLDACLEGQYSLGQAMKLGKLAFQCLNHRPKLRPTMDEVVTALEQIQESKDTTNS